MNKLLISLLSLVAVGTIGTGIAYGAGAFNGETKPPYGGEGQPKEDPHSSAH